MPLKVFFMAQLYHIPLVHSIGSIAARLAGVLVVVWSLSGQGIRHARCGLDKFSSTVFLLFGGRLCVVQGIMV